MDKAEKLASAKKKLKQYQSKAKPEKSENNSSDKQTPPSFTNCEEIAPPQVLKNTLLPDAILEAFTPTHANPTSDATEISNYFAESLANINKLSDNITNMIDPHSSFVPPDILELQQKNSDLVTNLNAEKNQNDQLRLEMRNQLSVIDDLKIEIDQLKLDNNTKVITEMGPLQEQLQYHVKTVGILVGEKAELTAFLNKYQNVLAEKSGENEELQARLNASRHKVHELEKEVENMKTANSRITELGDKLNFEINHCQQESEKFKQLYNDMEEKMDELRQQLLIKNQDFKIIQDQLERTNSELNLSKLKIEQLSSGQNLGNFDISFDQNARIESLTQQNLIKTQQINELQETVKQFGSERDQSYQEYRNYVLQLNDKVTELTKDNDHLSKREDELVRHISELERQIQLQLTKQQKYSHQNDDIDEKTIALENEIKILKEKVSTMELERAEQMQITETVESFRKQYEEKMREYSETISELNMTIEQLQMEKPDVAKLIAEIESGKLGASIAVSQNVELKAQLEEIQRAFVQISNDKLEITDRLQSELHLGREIKANYSTLETDLKSTKEQLRYKDQEMIRLTHEHNELNKQILQQNQEIDRLRYYESRNNDSSVLQMELQNSKELVKTLQTKLKEWEPRSPTKDSSCDKNLNLHSEIETLECEKDELLKVINDFQNRNRLIEESSRQQTVEIGSEPGSTATIPSIEAMEKLQARFKRTMTEIAELTDEKQRLEHLVLQLQGETETIGEYITLYQQQRRLLKQKDMERDLQLDALAADREKMKLKLKELNFLVHQLVQEKGGNVPKTAKNGHNESMENANVIEFDHNTNGDCHHNENHPDDHVHTTIKSTETAGRILSLLSDIKEANVAYGKGVQNCSCCSGKLETV